MFLLSISPATWFSNDNAKILQTRAKSSSLLECSAERRWILCKDTARFPSMQWNTYCRVSQSFISHVSTYCLLRPHTIFVISFVLFLALSLYDLTAVLTELFFVLLFPFLFFFVLTFIPCKQELNFNGRSHGNKMQKQRKFAWVSCLSNRKNWQENTHKCVQKKLQKKFAWEVST